jgi:hypothetical protein
MRSTFQSAIRAFLKLVATADAAAQHYQEKQVRHAIHEVSQ